jgi:predicted DNA-binding protein
MDQKKRIQILLSAEIEELLAKLSKEEHRTRSAIVELAILTYGTKTQKGN